MKKPIISLLMLCALLSINYLSAQNTPRRINPYGISETSPIYNDDSADCPEGTIVGNSIVTPGGFQVNDKEHTDDVRNYQSFSNVTEGITGIHFWGIHGVWTGSDWSPCEKENPIPFHISFHPINANGYPGEEITAFDIELQSTPTNLIYSGEYPVYEYTATWDTPVTLDEGYFSTYAQPSGAADCWFCNITDQDGEGTCLIQYGGSLSAVMNPLAYCLFGNGEPLATKDIKMTRILQPTTGSLGKYEKVEIEVRNIGTEALSNIPLKLTVNEDITILDTITETIQASETYKFFFKERIDCSAPNEYTISAENMLTDDELSYNNIVTTTLENFAGELCSSSGSCDEFISRVAYGSVDNQTNCSGGYADYSEMSATITPGEQISVTVEFGNPYQGDMATLWVDWNDNKSFNDPNESYPLNGTDPVLLQIPASGVKPGIKAMRIIIQYGSAPTPCGSFNYGETEDYSIEVIADENAPMIELQTSMIEETLDAGTSSNQNLELSNIGNGTLEASFTTAYALPDSPKHHPVKEATPPQINIRSKASFGDEPNNKEDNAYILHYDKKNKSSIGIPDYDPIRTATLYPASMLSHIQGMTLSSVDVYLAQGASNAKLIIYNQNTQSQPGETILEQSFTPSNDSWNTITLDDPITLNSNDLWIAIELSGITAGSYPLGVDMGPADAGFGDLLWVDGDAWWSLADIGGDYNFNIRANITGDKTPAISWLSVSPDNINAAAGQTETTTLNFNATGLSDNVYEAQIKISSNDPMASNVDLPVYLTVDGGTITAEFDQHKVSIYPVPASNEFNIHTDENIQRIEIFNINGQLVQYATGTGVHATINTDKLSNGAYFIKIIMPHSTISSQISIVK